MQNRFVLLLIIATVIYYYSTVIVINVCIVFYQEYTNDSFLEVTFRPINLEQKVENTI